MESIREQIQEDIITFFADKNVPEKWVDIICQIVVDNFNKGGEKNE